MTAGTATYVPVDDEPPQAGPLPRRRRLRRLVRVGLAVSVLFVVIFGWLTAQWFLWPHTTNPTQADAVVVLGGGEGERLTRGLELMNHKVSNVLVLSTGTDWFAPASVPVKSMCNNHPPEFEVVCIAAQPDSTKGEAMEISKMAKARGWRRIALVTTDFHLTRSTRWFERCFSGTIYPVGAPASLSVNEVVHEWLGTADQFLVDRSCS